MERRLAAILFADVVGYSRLMSEDEAGTLAALKAHRGELFLPKEAQYHGRTIKLMGDGVLMEFASVVDAVAFAVEIQFAMQQRNADIPEERRITYRIGINLGDIIVEGDDIYGDGVNITARLENVAEPGGVCISRPVHTQIKGKLDLNFEHLGKVAIKNIPEPVTVFRVMLDHKAAALVTSIVEEAGVKPKVLWWRAMAIAVVIVALAGGGLFWWHPWAPGFESTMIERPSLTLPRKPSIAVLPFTDMSRDPEQTYFADGITDDLITDLSKVSGLFVIARNSVFRYKNKTVKLGQVAEELGVRYVLEGSVRRSGNEVRINAQLIDTATGGHVWAERYDGSLDDIFGLQDTVARKIVSILAVQLTAVEKEQIGLRGTGNTEAYDVFLKGWEQYLRQTPKGFREAIKHFEKAVKLDPNYSRAYAALSATYWQIQKRFWHAKFGFGRVHDARFKAEEFLEEANRQPTSLSHQVAAAMLSLQGRHMEAIAEGGKAIGVDPNDADSYVVLAGALSLAGDADNALQLMQKAMRLNPHFPPFYLYELGLAQFGTGDFESAAVTLEKATTLNPEDRWSFRLLLASYGHLGRKEDAERITKVLAKNWRGYDPISVRAIAFWYPFKQSADSERLATGLRKASVPD
ncbi:MAG: adenylate/guanylate cyclase domain-containing protein [Hyphomicrobiaceae bacterium]